ncbi:4-hydroxythreonine-4-phosphate dehydrogenase PdxA [bacterium]|nr:4-hydroxythreonine-4-phosphate dehydrogenase PdxA [bacterium]
MNKIAITTGDPNGIGAEITVKALKALNLPKDKIVIVSNKILLKDLDKDYEIIEIPYSKSDIDYGHVTRAAGEFSFKSLVKVCELKPKAIVTGPVAKNALHLAGHNFNGQTEIIQKYLSHDGQLAEMLFVAGDFRVLLLTRHCALKEVNLTKELVIIKVQNLVKVLQKKFGIKSPKLALCGFNPHAGEDGILGNEEIDILIPAVNILNSQGIDISMPKPSDTLFINAGMNYLNKTKDEYDCYIANYHDQGLIPIKTVAGIKTVNTTIGLDIIRTSPGHGTAFDIAGKNIANPEGMIEAIKQVVFENK